MTGLKGIVMNVNSPDRSRSHTALRALLLAGFLVFGPPAASAQDAAPPPDATHEVVCECECGRFQVVVNCPATDVALWMPRAASS